jgi:hypothetical protein
LQEHEDDLHEAASVRVCSASSICNPQHNITWQLGSFPKDEEGAVAAQMPQHVVRSKNSNCASNPPLHHLLPSFVPLP